MAATSLLLPLVACCVFCPAVQEKARGARSEEREARSERGARRRLRLCASRLDLFLSRSSALLLLYFSGLPSLILHFTPHPPNIFLLLTSTFLSCFSTLVYSLVPALLHARSFYLLDNPLLHFNSHSFLCLTFAPAHDA